jgi:hypothetical protein
MKVGPTDAVVRRGAFIEFLRAGETEATPVAGTKCNGGTNAN